MCSMVREEICLTLTEAPHQSTRYTGGTDSISSRDACSPDNPPATAGGTDSISSRRYVRPQTTHPLPQVVLAPSRRDMRPPQISSIPANTRIAFAIRYRDDFLSDL